MTTEFNCEIQDVDRRLWKVVADASCEFEETKPGTDESFDGPLLRMTDFKVEFIRMSNGLEIKIAHSLAEMPDIFPEWECEWVESRANNALVEAMMEESL